MPIGPGDKSVAGKVVLGQGVGEGSDHEGGEDEAGYAGCEAEDADLLLEFLDCDSVHVVSRWDCELIFQFPS